MHRIKALLANFFFFFFLIVLEMNGLGHYRAVIRVKFGVKSTVLHLPPSPSLSLYVLQSSILLLESILDWACPQIVANYLNYSLYKTCGTTTWLVKTACHS